MNAQLTSRNSLRAYASWLREMQVSDVTGWRWRQRGWISTQNISGRCYVEQAEIDRFTERVRAGEFAKEPVVPENRGINTADNRKKVATSNQNKDH
jgi:hypothetical protein